MENLTGGTPPVRYLPCVVPCKLYFIETENSEIVDIVRGMSISLDELPLLLQKLKSGQFVPKMEGDE